MRAVFPPIVPDATVVPVGCEQPQAPAPALDQHVAMIVHDLRSPLLAVLGYADAIRNGDVETAPDAADRITSAGRHMLALVNDLLDLSKLQSEAPKVEFRPVNALRLFTDSVAVVSGTAEDKGLELKVDVSPDFPLEFPGDPRRLRQILINLLSNAVKFTEKGRIVLSAHVDPVAATCCLSVTDSGPGLSEAEIAQLFQPFRQTSAGARKGGTGLGLTISKRLAEAMGGSLVVCSRSGEGATFVLRLPLCARFSEARGEIPQLRGALQTFATPPALPPAKVQAALHCLVVDDDPLVRDLIVAMLRRHGHSVTALADGQAAIDLANDVAFDLVLLDRNLDDMDGFDVARALRARSGGLEMKIVGLSAHVDEDQKAAASIAGMDAFLSKTMRPADLIRQIEALFL